MKKIVFVFLLSFMFLLHLNAVSNVSYSIDDYLVDARIDVMGNLNVKEIIKVNGSFNGYIRDLVYKNSKLNEFTGRDEDFEGSAIYNASGIADIKVGKINWEGELTYKAFEEDVSFFEESDSCDFESNNCYIVSEITDGYSLKMYNETINSSTYFYIEYALGNVVVLHDDVAELYYNFIGEGFDDEINRYLLRVVLPSQTTEDVRVWAHGPLTGEVKLITEGDDDNLIYDGAYLYIEDLSANTPVDMRLVFPKALIFVDFEGLTKHSNTLALDKILSVETIRAEEANEIRRKARFYVVGAYILSGIYLLITSLLIVFVYLKYDKEYKSDFNNEYNREFIDDYDVTVIEYLLKKHISEQAFSTSILNLIYKKKIKVEEVDNKKDYKLTKINEEGITRAEKEVMEILFNKAGNGSELSLKGLKKYAKEIHGTTSPFLKGFEVWKNIVLDDSVKENFYENNTKIKLYLFLYCLLGFVLVFLHYNLGIFNFLTLIIIVATLGFLLYLLSFKKRTKKGADHYARWMAFKKFLEDFGRFDEKELPEIAIWERYLVYASIFNIADKVSKDMKIKFNEMNYNNTYYNSNVFVDYLYFNSINNSIHKAVTDSVSVANSEVSKAVAASSSMSSSGGFGGGFSSGGGFGGGGGGGRGF